jgi:hypothetical protein
VRRVVIADDALAGDESCELVGRHLVQAVLEVARDPGVRVERRVGLLGARLVHAVEVRLDRPTDTERAPERGCADPGRSGFTAAPATRGPCHFHEPRDTPAGASSDTERQLSWLTKPASGRGFEGDPDVIAHLEHPPQGVGHCKHVAWYGPLGPSSCHSSAVRFRPTAWHANSGHVVRSMFHTTRSLSMTVASWSVASARVAAHVPGSCGNGPPIAVSVSVYQSRGPCSRPSSEGGRPQLPRAPSREAARPHRVLARARSLEGRRPGVVRDRACSVRGGVSCRVPATRRRSARRAATSRPG